MQYCKSAQHRSTNSMHYPLTVLLLPLLLVLHTSQD
jgi:hypothetical protein